MLLFLSKTLFPTATTFWIQNALLVLWWLSSTLVDCRLKSLLVKPCRWYLLCFIAVITKVDVCFSCSQSSKQTHDSCWKSDHDTEQSSHKLIPAAGGYLYLIPVIEKRKIRLYISQQIGRGFIILQCINQVVSPPLLNAISGSSPQSGSLVSFLSGVWPWLCAGNGVEGFGFLFNV